MRKVLRRYAASVIFYDQPDTCLIDRGRGQHDPAGARSVPARILQEIGQNAQEMCPVAGDGKTPFHLYAKVRMFEGIQVLGSRCNQIRDRNGLDMERKLAVVGSG